MIEIIFFSFVFVIFVYLFITYRKYAEKTLYWENRGIPGPKPAVFFGNANQKMYKNGVLNTDQLAQWTKQYGNVFGAQDGLTNMLVISDPELVHEMVIKKFEYFPESKGSVLPGRLSLYFDSSGTRAKRLRTVQMVMYSSANLKNLLSIINDPVDKFLSILEKNVRERGIDFEFITLLHDLSTDLCLKIVLGIKDEDSTITTTTVTKARDYMHKNIGNAFAVSNNDIYSRLKKLKNQIFPQQTSTGDGHIYLDQLTNYVYKQIETRRNEFNNNNEPTKTYDSFLECFMKSEIPEEIHDDEQLIEKSNMKVPKYLSPEEVISITVTILLSFFGLDLPLAIILRQLAFNPDKQQKAVDEIEYYVGDQNPSFDDLQKMNYLDMCIKETLRLHNGSIARVNAKKCIETTKLGEYIVEKGTMVKVDLASLHRDERIWGANPNDFVPERWEAEEELHPGAWLSFGLGYRACPAKRLSFMQLKFLMVKIFQRFRVEKCLEAEERSESLDYPLLYKFIPIN